ncbi:hypothetical protein N9772_00475 [Bacteroidia bacterium]|nr:hypothetical protein [Bacteroidia bacterium]
MKKLLSLTDVLVACMANAQTPLLGQVNGAEVGDTIALFSAMDQDLTRYSVHIVAAIVVAGKIYRTGILMYGKKASYKELAKWLFYKN